MTENRSPWIWVLGFLAVGCASLPSPQYRKASFPKDEAFVGDVKRPYTKVGVVRSKVNYASLDSNHEEQDLCKNYYNASVRELVKFAHDKDADAVIQVKSVVFYEDGKQELHDTPECSDDGAEGQILTQGMAVKWKPEEKKDEKKKD